MTTDPRRALAALALVPVTAGAFAGAVAWAAAGVGAEAPEPQDAAVAAQLDAVRIRLGELRAEVAARAAQAVNGAPAASSSGAAGPGSTMHRRAPAARSAPPVDTTTRASG